ncbi:DinB family protein [Deinococcus radiophilus]|uniref:DinB family protein n=2 Tax=Deinococcus radiophilus TaxID=32062 RepID=A0A3S0IDU0_9DEIO|nr:DinB family protein [Deinococcus radiophilus]
MWDWLDEDDLEPQRGFPWWTLLLTGAAVAGAVWLARQRSDEIKELAVERLIEQPAAGQSFLKLEEGLQSGGEALVERIERASDNERNRERLRHIIGIERWGRARVQSAVLHRPWVMDEHHDYKPPKDKSLSELAEILAEQRRRTAALAHTLHENPPRLNEKVPHNGLGPLSVRGWLRYLQYHADVESRKLLP